MSPPRPVLLVPGSLGGEGVSKVCEVCLWAILGRRLDSASPRGAGLPSPPPASAHGAPDTLPPRSQAGETCTVLRGEENVPGLEWLLGWEPFGDEQILPPVGACVRSVEQGDQTCLVGAVTQFKEFLPQGPHPSVRRAPHPRLRSPESLAVQARNKRSFSPRRLPRPHSGRPAPASPSPSLPPGVPSCGKPSWTGLATRCLSPVLYRHRSPVPPCLWGQHGGDPLSLQPTQGLRPLCVPEAWPVTPSSCLQTNAVEQRRGASPVGRA